MSPPNVFVCVCVYLSVTEREKVYGVVLWNDFGVTCLCRLGSSVSVSLRALLSHMAELDLLHKPRNLWPKTTPINLRYLEKLKLTLQRAKTSCSLQQPLQLHHPNNAISTFWVNFFLTLFNCLKKQKQNAFNDHFFQITWILFSLRPKFYIPTVQFAYYVLFS